MGLIALLGAALVMIYISRRPEQSVESFAVANGLTLTCDTKSFVSFHLARMKVLRQWGAIAGFLAGLFTGPLFQRGGAVWFVFALVGSLVGMGMAEATRFFRQPSRETPRFAELERRDRSCYVSTPSRWVERAVIVAFVGSAIIAVTARSRTPLWARVAVVVTGAVIIVCGRLVGRSVAIRSVDPTKSERRLADDALRCAAVNVVVAIVASLTLCSTAWLLATPVKQTWVTVRFGNELVARIGNIGFPYEVSPAAGGSTEITWRHPTTGAVQSTIVPRSPSATAGDGSGAAPTSLLTIETSHPLFDQARGWAVEIATLLAFIAWLQVSRIPFRGRHNRSARRRLVGASA
jgi:hypothetical protein